MSQETSVRKRLITNIFSLGILQGANYLLPLLILPYLIRVLGSERFGMVVFAQSFVQYFIVLTDYGFNLTATKEIAIYQTDNSRVCQTFSTVMIIKFGLMLVSLVLMTGIVLGVPLFRADWQLYVITFFLVLGNVLFPLWFFQGMEQMKYITFLNVSAKLLTLPAIVFWVKEQGDYLLAALIYSLGPVITGLLSLLVVKSVFRITFYRPSFNEIKTALREGWHIFLTTVMSNILSSSGIFILGLFQSKEVVGAYAAVEKLIKAIIGIFAPVTRAVFPYVSSQFARSYGAGCRAVLATGKYIIIAALVVAVLTAVFAKTAVVILYGGELAGYSIVLSYLSIWLFLGVLNNVVGCQYLVGSGQAQLYSYSFLISGIVSLLLFFCFIPTYSYYGVLVGMNFGELVLTLVMLGFILKKK